MTTGCYAGRFGADIAQAGSLPAIHLGTYAGVAEALDLADEMESCRPRLADRLRYLAGLAVDAPLSRALELNQIWRDGCPTQEEIADSAAMFRHAQRTPSGSRSPGLEIEHLRIAVREYLRRHKAKTARELAAEFEVSPAKMRWALCRCAAFESHFHKWSLRPVDEEPAEEADEEWST